MAPFAKHQTSWARSGRQKLHHRHRWARRFNITYFSSMLTGGSEWRDRSVSGVYWATGINCHALRKSWLTREQTSGAQQQPIRRALLSVAASYNRLEEFDNAVRRGGHIVRPLVEKDIERSVAGCQPAGSSRLVSRDGFSASRSSLNPAGPGINGEQPLLVLTRCRKRKNVGIQCWWPV